jgi:hypothetical protein
MLCPYGACQGRGCVGVASGEAIAGQGTCATEEAGQTNTRPLPPTQPSDRWHRFANLCGTQVPSVTARATPRVRLGSPLTRRSQVRGPALQRRPDRRTRGLSLRPSQVIGGTGSPTCAAPRLRRPALVAFQSPLTRRSQDAILRYGRRPSRALPYFAGFAPLPARTSRTSPSRASKLRGLSRKAWTGRYS